VNTADRLKRDKRALRAQIRELRDRLSPPERDRLSRAIARELFALPEMERADVVMAFSSFGSEVDTGPILERLSAGGRRLALPRVRDGDIEGLAFAPGQELRQARFGALEPVDGAPVAPEEVDLVVTPGVAFDRRGFRVGYGGGFYDRFFRRTRSDVVKAAVCFGLQVVERVPHGAQDLPVDLLVTEDGVILCR
jgi:5-formyltetrahydrofolate cyclo-ligase